MTYIQHLDKAAQEHGFKDYWDVIRALDNMSISDNKKEFIRDEAMSNVLEEIRSEIKKAP